MEPRNRCGIGIRRYGMPRHESPVVLIAGTTTLHGGWDLLHEVQAHTQVDVFGGKRSDKDSSRLWRILYNVRLGPWPIFFAIDARHWVAACEVTSVIMEVGQPRLPWRTMPSPAVA